MEHPLSLCLREGKINHLCLYVPKMVTGPSSSLGASTVCHILALCYVSPIKPALETRSRGEKHVFFNGYSEQRVCTEQSDNHALVVFVHVQGSQLIVAYDEHEVNNTFKFGAIYQRFGQVRIPPFISQVSCTWIHIW